MSRARALLAATATWIAALAATAPAGTAFAATTPRPDPDCAEHWRAGRLPPPEVGERCAGEFRRLALEYRRALAELAIRFPADLVWLPGEERIARLSSAELLALRARGDALERILPERDRLEARILDPVAPGPERDEALARYRQVLGAELALDLATAPSTLDAVEAFRARHAPTRSDRAALAVVAAEVADEARERLAAADRAKFDPTLRGFVWLTRMPDGVLGSAASAVAGTAAAGPARARPPDDGPPLGDAIAFGDPPPIDFPIPGSGGTCPGEPRAPAAREDGPPLGDAIVFGEPPPIAFPIPGEGGICPTEPRRDAFARGPGDEARGEGPKDEGPPLGGVIAFGVPPPIVFPIPGEGGICPLEPRDGIVVPPIDLVAAGFGYNDVAIAAAPRDPRRQIVIATFPTVRLRAAGDGAGTIVVPTDGVPGGGLFEWDPDGLRIYVTTVGPLGPGGAEVSVVGPDPAAVAGETVVLEPVALDPEVKEEILLRRRQAARSGSEETTGADTYCVDFHREPPLEGTYLRLAPYEVQLEHEPERRAIAAAERVRDEGRLVPDSDPDSYFHFVVQWSIWTMVEAFDRARFEEAFVEHTRRNFEESDQPWNEEIERAVRSLAPGRWSDIQKVMEASKEESEPKGDPS